MSVLVVIAVAAEARYLPAEFDWTLAGIGKSAAAISTTCAIIERQPSLVTNAGTAGALRDGMEGLHEIGTVVNHDMNAEAIRALGLDPRERLTLSDSDVGGVCGGTCLPGARSARADGQACVRPGG